MPSELFGGYLSQGRRILKTLPIKLGWIIFKYSEDHKSKARRLVSKFPATFHRCQSRPSHRGYAMFDQLLPPWLKRSIPT